MELLRTEATIVRLWRDDDVDRLVDMTSRPEVMRWLDDDQEHPKLTTTREGGLAAIARYRARSAAAGPIGFWCIEERATGQAVGTVLLCGAGDGPDDGPLEIGWHLHPDAWGRGLARSAAAGLLAAAFAAGIDEVHALLYVDNEPSARVCRAIGMVEQEHVFDTWYPGESRHFLARRSEPEPGADPG